MAALAHQIRPTLAGSVRSSALAREAGAMAGLERAATASAHKQWASGDPVRAERKRELKQVSLAGLSPRCVQIARHYAGGFQEKEIAALFNVQRTIVARERDRFKQATGAVTRRDIVLACRQHGLEPV